MFENVHCTIVVDTYTETMIPAFTGHSVCVLGVDRAFPSCAHYKSSHVVSRLCSFHFPWVPEDPVD